MAKQTSTVVRLEKPKVRRRGVHSKCKMSKSKSSRNYVKPYKGQGKS